MKRDFGNRINALSRVGIKIIQKEDFLLAFRAIHNSVFSEKHCKAAWEGAGLIPLNANTVISRLDVRPVTPLPRQETEAWVSQTPRTAKESLRQIEYVQKAILAHDDTDPQHIFAAMMSAMKDHESQVHSQALIAKQLDETMAANARLSVRAKQKRKRIQKGDQGLVGDDIFEQRRVSALKNISELRVEEENGEGGSPSVRKERKCGMCK